MNDDKEISKKPKNSQRKSFFEIFGIKNYKWSFLFLIHSLNICTIIFIYLFNYFLIFTLISDVSDHYFNKYVIEPISTEFESINQEMSVRLRAQEDILLESKMNNFKIYSEFYFSQDNESKKKYYHFHFYVSINK